MLVRRPDFWSSRTKLGADPEHLQDSRTVLDGLGPMPARRRQAKPDATGCRGARQVTCGRVVKPRSIRASF